MASAAQPTSSPSWRSYLPQMTQSTTVSALRKVTALVTAGFAGVELKKGNYKDAACLAGIALGISHPSLKDVKDLGKGTWSMTHNTVRFAANNFPAIAGFAAGSVAAFSRHQQGDYRGTVVFGGAAALPIIEYVGHHVSKKDGFERVSASSPSETTAKSGWFRGIW